MIVYEKRGQVGILTINRPKALNALNREVLKELDCFLDTGFQHEIRCLIVTGAGEKSFVAGADIGSMAALDKAGAEVWGLFGNRVFRKLEKLTIPTIAAVNGFALGGGCELAMSCDIRIASENAVFGQPEVTLGIIAGFGGTQRLARLVGAGMAKELLYTASKIKAGEALRIGLVNHVYSPQTLLEEAVKLAERIAANAPIGVRMTKLAVDGGMECPIDQGIKLEAKLFGSCFETQDQQNAMVAFLEKRKPGAFQNQ